MSPEGFEPSIDRSEAGNVVHYTTGPSAELYMEAV